MKQKGNENRQKDKTVGKKATWKIWLKWIVIAIVCFAIYVIAGIIVPFIKHKEVSEKFKQQYSSDNFYSDEISVDRAAIIEDSKEALDIRIQMINQAEETILLSTFSMKRDRVCREINSALYAAAQRGVKVMVLVDGLSGGIDMWKHPMYYALASHDNIEIRYYNMPTLMTSWKINGRLHDKYLMVDDKMVILGGRNTSNYFLGEYNTKVLSYDREIFVYNTADTPQQSVLQEVEDYFYSLWDHEASEQVFHKPPRGKKKKINDILNQYPIIYQTMMEEHPEYARENTDLLKRTVAVNKISLISNPIHIWSKEPYIWYTLEQLMKGAKHTVLIQTPYAVMNNSMYQTMKEVNAGLDTYEMLVNGVAIGDNICASSDYLINRKKVLKTGVDVYEFQGKHSMHNKSVVIDDDLSIIGSFNFDMRSAYLDTETMLVVHGEEFNSLLTKEIRRMKDDSIHVLTDGTYDPESTVEPVKLKGIKKYLYYITPYVFQLIRYLL